MSERIAIVGAGAVGAYVGGYFARAGEDVTLIDPWPEHVEAMRRDGLSLSGMTEGECFTTPVKAMHLTDVQSLARTGPIDIAFVCTKSYDTDWATAMIRGYLAPDATVVSLQNCINEETIARIVGWGRVVGCIAAKIAVELTGPAQVRRGVPLGGNKHTVFRVGEVHGRITPRIERIATMLGRVDSAKTTSNLWGERWSKLCANAQANGVSAATGLGNNGMAREPVTRWLSIRLAGEAARIGRALGYELETINKFSADDWIAATDGDAAVRERIEAEMIAACEGRSETGRPSMGQDIAKGRRTEIEMLNGYIVERGKEIGLAAPANAGLTAAVQAVERGEAPPGLERVAGI
ncbi:2-dehydropantoate 2-reductase [Thalassobaculum fulvum]|uniref:2-dehydropantoate 2-reductase n=1 Tax=Thalassobaculum fulvum TaxID=1633335 RepID=A0A918XTN5_9PROT|nr:2-dehydropantoate 2-reductase [Thalassobaculum fulvum]GHD55340.1 2-dehydropantoate 2-reductase [Thalassobaculum fulvum]